LLWHSQLGGTLNHSLYLSQGTHYARRHVTIIEKLKKYKISTARYREEQQALHLLGYTDQQANRLIVRQSSMQTVVTVRTLHHTLVSKGFTRAEITRMASRNGGGNNLKAVLGNHYNGLIAQGFKHNDIVRMVSHGGGSRNLGAVSAHFDALSRLGFKVDNIVKMVSHVGGSRNLGAVSAHYDALSWLGFEVDNIVQMVSHAGGSRNLGAVSAHYDALSRLGFKADNILQMVSHGGGSCNLGAVSEHYDALSRLGFKADNIVRMVSHDGGTKSLGTIIDHCLIIQGSTCLSRDDIVCLLSAGSQGRKQLLQQLSRITRHTAEQHSPDEQSWLAALLPAERDFFVDDKQPSAQDIAWVDSLFSHDSPPIPSPMHGANPVLFFEAGSRKRSRNDDDPGSVSEQHPSKVSRPNA